MSAKTILQTQRCEGCGALCNPDELMFCLECQESYCGHKAINCTCSCSRLKIAAYDAVHGAGAYERQAEEEISSVTAEEFARAVLSRNRGDA